MFLHRSWQSLICFQRLLQVLSCWYQRISFSLQQWRNAPLNVFITTCVCQSSFVLFWYMFRYVVFLFLSFVSVAMEINKNVSITIAKGENRRKYWLIVQLINSSVDLSIDYWLTFGAVILHVLLKQKGTDIDRQTDRQHTCRQADEKTTYRLTDRQITDNIHADRQTKIQHTGWRTGRQIAGWYWKYLITDLFPFKHSYLLVFFSKEFYI